jgi:hypothetical protein
VATTNVAAVRYEAFGVNPKEWLQYRAFKAISDLREAWANKEPLANQIMAITAVRALHMMGILRDSLGLTSLPYAHSPGGRQAHTFRDRSGSSVRASWRLCQRRGCGNNDHPAARGDAQDGALSTTADFAAVAT